jgi:hypothetical protein
LSGLLAETGSPPVKETVIRLGQALKRLFVSENRMKRAFVLASFGKLKFWLTLADSFIRSDSDAAND